MERFLEAGKWNDLNTNKYNERRALHVFEPFQRSPGASPEELLAAAHAGCFNQALANNCGMISLKAESIS
jgi:organic hydroperoxide reductase OsmC/OhrA